MILSTFHISDYLISLIISLFRRVPKSAQDNADETSQQIPVLVGPCFNDNDLQEKLDNFKLHLVLVQKVL